MRMFKHKLSFLQMLKESIAVLVGAILIWRGIWVLLDLLDQWLFGGEHLFSAIFGIIIGAFLIYIVDRDLEDVV